MFQNIFLLLIYLLLLIIVITLFFFLFWKFFNASDLDKSFFNEKNEITISSEIGNLKVIQIAGFLARTIKCFCKTGQYLDKLEKIGLINLGSQVTLILNSKKIRLNCKIGDQVKGGETILARII